MGLKANEAYRKARPGNSVIGWKVDARQRDELLARVPATYAKVIADHVTLKPRVDASSALPDPVHARIVGRADDGIGVEAMVVEVDGSVDRPDGSTYHITWSLAEALPGDRIAILGARDDSLSEFARELVDRLGS